ncbi:transposase [Streptomyces sp. NPDC059717]|uniref:transposase n=1 Tax=Streptomyces sp. NPDC059717 TaxID=3346922 RepID=UPI0036B86642
MGTLGGTVSERKPCKTDVSDQQWALVEPVIAARKAAHPSVSGHQGRYAIREIINTLLYQGRTGCQWELLPDGFPPDGAVSAQAETTREQITQLTARLDELGRAAEVVRIARKTLLALPAPKPAATGRPERTTTPRRPIADH